MTGRPSTYTDKMAAKICEQIVAGKSVRDICKQKGFPNASTVFRWLSANETFREQYARAREAQSEVMAQEMLDIADKSTGDVQRDKLRIDTRKWLASKLKPKKYGDKMELNGNADAPLQVVVRKFKHEETEE